MYKCLAVLWFSLTADLNIATYFDQQFLYILFLFMLNGDLVYTLTFGINLLHWQQNAAISLS